VEGPGDPSKAIGRFGKGKIGKERQGVTAALKIVEPQPLRLDIGCGKNKQAGFIGVDRIAFDGVDHVVDVTAAPLPFETSTVDEVFSSHFVEHLTQVQRCAFFNEIWRVLKPGAKATIITPHWSNARAYGDPTHQWPAISEWFYLYLNKEWRAANAPHTDAEHWPQGYACDFEGGCVTTVNTQHPELSGRNVDMQNFATRNYINVNVDAYATLTAKK
jgi:SAM-dependent methyltransferase